MNQVRRSDRPRPATTAASRGARILGAVIVLIGLITIFWPRAAFGWGRTGHRASAVLAQARLSPTARAAIVALLEPGETLVDASTWPDEVRGRRPRTGAWHYLNLAVDSPRGTETGVPDVGVVGKIDEFSRRLADPTASLLERREALRFLVHLVQDLHQPLHVGDRGNRGGNDLQVRFFDRSSNLHRVWDSELIERAYSDEWALTADLARLADGPSATRWASGSVLDWAAESLAAARLAYGDPTDASPIRPGARLGSAYLETNLPIARLRLAQAGVRLAALLNQTFGED